MNDLYRNLAPVTSAAWDQIEQEASRTFTRHLAGRRVVDLAEPGGPELAAVGTGHLTALDSPGSGVRARRRQVSPLVELRVPFVLDRQAVDDVERGSQDSDWQPVKDAAKQMAWAEDRVIFEGYSAAEITGIRAASSNPPLTLPANAEQYPDVVSRALTQLRLSGVNGPYALVLSADQYTLVSETTDHGYPIRQLLQRAGVEEIIWAPAIDGGFVLSTRGGDFELHLGQDLSIGYLSHDADTVQLYLQQTLTFLPYTAEAVVTLG